MHRLHRAGLCTLVLTLLAGASFGEVRVTIDHQPVGEISEPRDRTRSNPGPLSSTRTRVSSAGVTESVVWFINSFRVDTERISDATLWSVRNVSGAPVDIEVLYYDASSATPEVVEMYSVPVNAVQSRNTRDVVGLSVDGDGFARGHIVIEASDEIAVDFIQLIASQNFATSEVAATLEDVCSLVLVRFLDFGGELGSVASFLIDDPQGSEIGDDPTLIGTVYDEDGAFINTFEVLTDQYSFQLNLRDLVLPGTSFGSIEIDALAADGALATITHNADGRFSVGNQAFCLDTPPAV